jgi:hypothetical protein
MSPELFHGSCGAQQLQACDIWALERYCARCLVRVRARWRRRLTLQLEQAATTHIIYGELGAWARLMKTGRLPEPGARHERRAKRSWASTGRWNVRRAALALHGEFIDTCLLHQCAKRPSGAEEPFGADTCQHSCHPSAVHRPALLRRPVIVEADTSCHVYHESRRRSARAVAVPLSDRFPVVLVPPEQVRYRSFSGWKSV